ncbi:MAG: sigma-70 family RNA polymerase sigma factor [Armatimonadetes bacterium]|nr:sigma-70 family RNA polymerase sigma factor [Armatimonadota bacterium]
MAAGGIITERHRMDGILVARAQAGDPDAFEQLYARHQRRVYRLALGMLRNLEDAEDVTQETFLNAYRALPGLADGQAFHAWTTRIAVNLCRRRARVSGSRSLLSLDAENADTGECLQIPDARPLPEEAVQVGELRREVRSAIAGLPREFREVVILHEMDGLKLHEVAQALGVPLGTAKSRLSRGRKYLKRALSAYVCAGDRLAPPRRRAAPLLLAGCSL